MNFSPIPAILKDFSKPFKSNGFELYAVGGAVRDFCLGKKNSDFDFATDAAPIDVKRLFPKVIPTGIKHGTVTVLFKGEMFEVTTFRTENGYVDCRHPDSVEFVSSLEEDLKRRDFTINALAVKIPDPKIIDLHGGLPDLKNHLIRCIGVPHDRFMEDALRMMRACRFSSQLGFEIESATFDAICELKDNIKFVSLERIQEELSRIIMSSNPRKGIEALSRSGLLDLILPELAACRLVQQLGYHHEDVYYHSLSALDAAASRDWSLEVRLAALLHDIGKPPCQEKAENRYTFYNHEIAGAKMTKELLRRLKYPNSVIDKVSTLVRNHMFNYTPDWTDGAVRRFILRCGKDNVDDVLRLRLADQLAMSGNCINPNVDQLESRIKAIESPSLTVNDLALTGDDLKAMGLKPGPVFSEIKEFLLQQVLDRPELNTKEQLSQIAQKYISNRH
ncbi:MAG: HD domain-containing protein [Sphaerochaetaceae bacterium]|nr:HD domain-containing protein [Sphaerochaetaceae bacterium]